MRYSVKKFKRGVFVIFVLLASSAAGSHLRSADILVERICGTLTYRITITAYLNSLSPVQFGGNGRVQFGDGEFAEIPSTISTLRPDLGPNVSVATFITEHTYEQEGEYIIAFIEHSRNAGVVNIVQSSAIAYASFVKIKIKETLGCNTVPRLTILPLDRGCSGKTFFHNPGAYDAEGDSLSYELVTPVGDDAETVLYKPANDPAFYSGFYPTSNEAKDGAPSFSIDPITGLFKWDAPGNSGEYSVAFRIDEWRKNSSGVYELLSSTTRDMQILIEDCNNDRPDLSIPDDTCVVAGSAIKKTITGTDRNGDLIKVELFSEITLLPPDRSPATYSPLTPVFESSPSSLSFEWNTTCANVRQQPYQVNFKVTDNGQGARLSTYKTWAVRVVAPAPVWKTTILDVVHHHVLLEWEPYDCINAQKIQIWRRVGSYNYSPESCETGLPAYSVYSLIGQVDAGATTFTDTNNDRGLSPGAQYCYRLVAVFPETESIVSDERCEGPVEADAPVITHVSVERTAAEGEVRVSWRTPFNINAVQFPTPYEYEVYRSEGTTAEEEPVLVSGRILDTTFLDHGINTDQKAFNYRIVIYSKPVLSQVFVPVDTSAVASSARLTSRPLEGKIELTWRANVPWSNVAQQRPYHLIYRATGVGSDEDLDLIDSVDVTQQGFRYVDENIVNNNQAYTYRIQTRGTYGNPKIALQKNFSQLHTAYPVTNLQPCAPTVSIQVTDCELYRGPDNCNQTDFNNVLDWSEVTEGCRADIKSYNVYAADLVDGDYVLIAAGITGKHFTETGLPSFARCYRVSTVDGAGHESAMSDPVCNDNCPYYQLPNVFTPNEDGCNDKFSARYNMDNEGSPCAVGEPQRCPRFVKAVNLTVLNRWGREVYHFTSSDENGIYVDWNGKDSNNEDLRAGIYYYVAEVTYNVVNPAKRSQKIKGWVHILR